MQKRGQHTVGLPFGLIFSIFLIVLFIIIAFIAINHFLDIGRCSEVGRFYEDLQSEVNSALSQQLTETEFEINLPSGINKICFSNLSSTISNLEDYEIIKNYYVYEANLFLIPPEKACNMPYKLISHINISEITTNKNPYCVDVSRNLKLKKDFYDKSVLIE